MHDIGFLRHGSEKDTVEVLKVRGEKLHPLLTGRAIDYGRRSSRKGRISRVRGAHGGESQNIGIRKADFYRRGGGPSNLPPAGVRAG